MIPAFLRRLLYRHPFLYRLRYALVCRLGTTGDFTVQGPVEGAPSKRASSALRLFTTESGLRQGTTRERALQLALALSTGRERGPGIGLDTTACLEMIKRGGRGVCSDYTQAFQALCWSLGIACREWGLTDDLLSPTVGHTVSEVFLPEEQCWMLIDPFLSLWISDGVGAPVSVPDLAQAAESSDFTRFCRRVIDPALPERVRRYHDLFFDRYFSSRGVVFLIGGGDPFRQDSLLRWGRVLPPPVIHGLLLLLGRHGRFLLYTTAWSRSRHERQLAVLHSWRRRLIGGGLIAGLGALLAALLAT